MTPLQATTDIRTGRVPTQQWWVSSVDSFELLNNRARSAAKDSYLDIRNPAVLAGSETML
jgi:hypothetical protein